MIEGKKSLLSYLREKKKAKVVHFEEKHSIEVEL